MARTRKDFVVIGKDVYPKKCRCIGGTSESGRYYTIISLNPDPFYNDIFIGNQWAVAVRYGGCLQQVSKWYSYFGNAENYLIECLSR